MKRPLANKRPLGPLFEYNQSDNIEGRTMFIEDEDEFIKAVRNTIEVTENVTVLRETQESVDIRIDAIDKRTFLRSTK